MADVDLICSQDLPNLTGDEEIKEKKHKKKEKTEKKEKKDKKDKKDKKERRNNKKDDDAKDKQQPSQQQDKPPSPATPTSQPTLQLMTSPTSQPTPQLPSTASTTPAPTPATAHPAHAEAGTKHWGWKDGAWHELQQDATGQWVFPTTITPNEKERVDAALNRATTQEITQDNPSSVGTNIAEEVPEGQNVPDNQKAKKRAHYMRFLRSLKSMALNTLLKFPHFCVHDKPTRS